ncbi:hypothetical protein EBR04_01075 [bacterium]|nr:hypothetical protein [bacterium]
MKNKRETMPLDHSVYPELASPPDALPTPEAKADYLHRICAAFDFGIFPEREDWDRFASWREIFDAYPLPDSPAYHTFRARFGWPPAARAASCRPGKCRIAARAELIRAPTPSEWRQKPDPADGPT